MSSEIANPLNSPYAGADWLVRQRRWIKGKRGGLTGHYESIVLSKFGCLVADIVGHAWRGIYHIDKAVTHQRCRWDDRKCIELVVYGELATFDDNKLTQLVVLCHDHAVRLSVDGASRGYLRLMFHRRKRKEPGDHVFAWHPSLDESVARVRAGEPVR